MLPHDPFFQELLMFQQMDNGDRRAGEGARRLRYGFGVGLFRRCDVTYCRLVGLGLKLDLGAQFRAIGDVILASCERQFSP